MSLVNRIKQLCDAHEESFASLERKMDFGNGTIRKWDKAIPSGDKLAKIADYFNVPVDYLLGRTSGVEESIEKVCLPESIENQLSTIGERLKAVRKLKGYSAEYIAQQINVHPATIYRYENNEIQKMNVETAIALAQLLNVSLDYFLLGIDSQSCEKQPEKEFELNTFSVVARNGFTINGNITDSQLSSILAVLKIPGIGNVESDQSVK